MRKQSWKNSRCRKCPFLFVAGGELFQCGKLKVLPQEFESVHLKNPRINKTCPGIKDLPGVEANIQKLYDILKQVKVG